MMHRALLPLAMCAGTGDALGPTRALGAQSHRCSGHRQKLDQHHTLNETCRARERLRMLGLKLSRKRRRVATQTKTRPVRSLCARQIVDRLL